MSLQARFRLRQKEKHSQTERQMSELQVAHKQLQLERDRLIAKADHLERRLTEREATLHIAQAPVATVAAATAPAFAGLGAEPTADSGRDLSKVGPRTDCDVSARSAPK